MLISCLCPTYNRPPLYGHLLEEAIESFRRQVLPDGVTAELVILSDAPGQELVCDTPGVRIIHAPARFASLGAKYNELARLAQGELLLPWEDDDLALSHRIAQAIRAIGEARYWNPQALYYWPAGQKPVRDHGGVCHNASAYRKDAWQAVGGYPETSGNQDAVFDAALRKLGRVARPLLPFEQPAYVYRWGVSPCHLSGQAGGSPGDPHAPHYRAVGEKPVMPGRFILRPHWREDYEQLCLQTAPPETSLVDVSGGQHKTWFWDRSKGKWKSVC